MSVEVDLLNLITDVIPETYATVNPDMSILPYCNFFQISPSRDYTHDGFSGLSKPRWQIDTYDKTYQGIRTLGQAIITTLEKSKFNAKLQNQIDATRQDGEGFKLILDFYLDVKEW